MKALNLKNNSSLLIIDDDDFNLVKDYTWYALVSKKKNGTKIYVYGRVNGDNIFFHRFIMNAKYNQTIDHKNGNTLDNRKKNLRFSTLSQNQINRKKQKNNKSGFKGVCYKRNRWFAQIQKESKKYNIGYFDNPAKAAIAYDKKAFELFGTFATLNFPQTGGDAKMDTVRPKRVYLF